MKNLKLLLIALVAPMTLFAQQGINYQAVVRDGGGAIVANQAVAVEFSIRETSANGNIVYTETHDPNTNDYGLINVVIGQGNVQSGVFADIDWGGDIHFLDITIDGNNLGSVEFQAVPYSYHANAMTNVTPNTAAADVHIEADDDFATMMINPTSATSNDSSAILFGEGTNTGNGMAITYNGVDNVLKVSGSTNVNSYIGPYLSISRDQGTATFSNGVEVVETTETPAPNTVYGNSGPLAYGYFSGTNITTDFGVASIASPGVGEFTVVLDNAWLGSPVVVATSLNNSADTEHITYSTTGSNTINIRIVDENNNPVTSNFSLVVYGNAQ
ncbi:MAG: hypothetical protein NXI10_05805 [bacterium]|nr:hypothetical protein [bacterium]